MRRILLAVIIAVLGIAVIAGGTYAWSYFKNVQGTVNVVTSQASTISIDIFADQAATQQLDMLNFGNVNQGATSTREFYVKNTGTLAGRVQITTENLAQNVGSINYTQASPNLAPGAVENVSACLAVNQGAPLGVANFTIRVEANQ